MTRIDPNSPVDRETLKEEIKAELHQEERKKKRLHCLGCGVIWLLVIGLPLLWLGVSVAKTGLVKVPVLTARYFKPSEPVRPIAPLAGSTSEDVMHSIAASAKLDRQKGEVSFALKETQLTTLIAEGFSSAGDSLPFPINQAQTAVEPDRIEFFATTPRDGREVTLKADVMPQVVAGRLKVSINHVRIGALELPNLLEYLASSILSGIISDALNRSVSAIGQLTAVSLEAGALLMSVKPQ